jgi:hypothetical protein
MNYSLFNVALSFKLCFLPIHRKEKAMTPCLFVKTIWQKEIKPPQRPLARLFPAAWAGRMGQCSFFL